MTINWDELRQEMERRREDIARRDETKPSHYKVVCISLYAEDLELADKLVTELKRRGHTRASRSSLIRIALRMLDLDTLAPPINLK